MGIMGLGGLIAIIGGLLYLIIAFRALWPEKSKVRVKAQSAWQKMPY